MGIIKVVKAPTKKPVTIVFFRPTTSKITPMKITTGIPINCPYDKVFELIVDALSAVRS